VSTVALWRIATETRDYKANDLSGTGSARSPGRWNATGEHVIYAAPTIALAVLETAAHLDPAGLPLNRFLVRLDVPSDVYVQQVELEPDKIDAAWSAIPSGRASVDLGSSWYQAGKTPLLLVPSVIVPEERAVVINAKHALAGKISATTVRQFTYTTVFR
jgi:RES domain-containing protein